MLDVHKDKSEFDPIDKVSTLTEHIPFKGPKKSQFSGLTPLPMALEMDLPASV